MSLLVGKCLACGRLFQASEKDNVGWIDIAGQKFRVELCDNDVRQLKAEQDAHRRALGLIP